jgi:XRE family aerobic/anaerobic benzoate catabolism transcriptional regulator
MNPQAAPRIRKNAAPESAVDDAFLEALAARVRDARARRGMSRRILAEASGVSERYLAELEGGRGNASVLLLRQIAAALSMPLADLLDPAQERAVERVLIDQLLDRIPAHRLAEVRRQLGRELAQDGQRAHARVALLGLRGAGKSTLGRRLAEGLRVPFVELDREVEREAGTSLSEVFLLYGQAGYRRYERRCLEKVLERNASCVIATGGSIVSEPATFGLLLDTCTTVWLKAAPEEHMARVIAQGDTRPMADNPEAMADLRRILEGRERLYGQADVVIDTEGRTVEQSLRELKRAVRNADGKRSR